MAKIKKLNKEDVELTLLSLIASTLFFKESINSLFFILYVVFWIKNKRYSSIRTEKIFIAKYYFLIVILYLVIIIFGNIASYDTSKAFDLLLKQTTILLFPLLLTHLQFGAKQREYFNTVFLVSVLGYLFFLALNAGEQVLSNNSWYTVDPEHPTWKYYFFTTARLSPFLHPTFLSMYITYCVFALLFGRQVNMYFRRPVLKYLTVSVLVSFLLLLSSRGALFAIMIVFIGYEFYRLLFEKELKSLLRAGGVVLLIFVIFSNNDVFNRISKLRHLVSQSPNEIAQISNSSGKRMQIYLIGNEMLRDNFWFGIGTKNWEVYNKKYYEKKFLNKFDYNIETMNTHNQYLDAAISWGFFGALVLVLLIFYQIYFGSLVRADNSMLLFWCFFAVLLLTENILNRHRGIIFFSLISGITLLSSLKGKKEIQEKVMEE